MSRRSVVRRWYVPRGILLGSVHLFALCGCAKLVGIESTEVAAAAGGAGGAAAASGAADGGASGAGTSGSNGAGASGAAGAGTSGASGAGVGGASGAGAGGASGAGVGGASGAGSGGAGAGAGASGAAGAGGSAGSTMGGGASGTSGAAAGAGGAGGSVCPLCPRDRPTCEAGACIVRGPTLVHVVGNAAGTPIDYYVDSTEVTAGQYQQFLDSSPDLNAQPAACAWNTSFSPAAPILNPNLPVTYVNWCDAAAFCAWAGKRLCGHIGGQPIRPDMTDVFFDPAQSEWYLGCAGPLKFAHPYGAAQGRCNDAAPGSTLAAVASFASCEGAYAGLFDMEGNALEWVDSCDADTGMNDQCRCAGGSYAISSACDILSVLPRNRQAPALGFRCCGG